MQTITSKVADDYFPPDRIDYKIVENDGEVAVFNTNYDQVQQSDVVVNINLLANICHAAAAVNGWWHHKIGTKPTVSDGEIYSATSQERTVRYVEEDIYELKEMNVGERIALMHSELSEALEAARKNFQSDHIPEFTGMEEELADCMIRILDMAGAAKLRLGEALVAKLRYNAERADHKMEHRMAPGGKQL